MTNKPETLQQAVGALDVLGRRLYDLGRYAVDTCHDGSRPFPEVVKPETLGNMATLVCSASDESEAPGFVGWWQEAWALKGGMIQEVKIDRHEVVDALEERQQHMAVRGSRVAPMATETRMRWYPEIGVGVTVAPGEDIFVTKATFTMGMAAANRATSHEVYTMTLAPSDEGLSRRSAGRRVRYGHMAQ